MKVALVTAGGSGMGAACARRLKADGYEVGVMSPSGRGKALGEELGGYGVTGSNESEADLTVLVDGALERWGRVDALVNSAGHGPRGPVLEMTDADWLRGFEVYFLSAVRAIRAVAPVMEAQGSGAVVNISTFAAFEPDPAFPASGVARAGLASFVKLLSDQWAPKGLRINNLLPGFIDSFPASEERMQAIPMKRYGSVDEVAAVAAFLVSEGAGYITGQNLRVDGGITRAV